MRKILYSFFAILFISSQSLLAAGYIATYSMKVSNPAAYVEAMDELMSSKWGKDFPAAVSIHSYAFNGYDDATHVVVLNYNDVESAGKGTASFVDPTFQNFLAKTSSIVENVEQSLSMKLMGGGNQDPENNQAYTVYRMKVKDPASYAKAYAKVTKAVTHVVRWATKEAFLRDQGIQCKEFDAMVGKIAQIGGTEYISITSASSLS